MPARLLPLLDEAPQSGEALARQLGVSRASVHALAHALREQGYPVTAGRSGYGLEPGTPAPRLLERCGWVAGAGYRYLGRVGSTQDELRAWAADPEHPAPPGAVLLAEEQTAGRGRRGRPWSDPTADGAGWEGRNLTFSLLLPGPLPLTHLGLLPLAAGVALQEAVEVAGVPGTRLKWPNDLLAPDGRKLAGLLLEADLRGEEVRRAVLGVGLNVGWAPPGAACLTGLASEPGLRRDRLLAGVLAALRDWLPAESARVLAAWRTASGTLGRPVRVQTPAGEVVGVALDLGSDGSLLVRTPSGTVRVTAGDVELVGPLSPAQAPPFPDHSPTRCVHQETP
ncbi:MAG: biotin--[acetyl-CoA-carboxylase] ligase [Deinococcus sp.]